MSLGLGSRPAIPPPESPRSPGTLWPNVAFIAFGLISALAVAALLAWIYVTFRFAAYAFTILFVPVGAFFCGTAAGVGYIVGARLLRRKPGPIVRIGAIATSALSFVAIYYLQYRAISTGGVALSSVMPFGDYIDLVMRGASVGFLGVIRTNPLGVAGYGLATVHLAGYLFGGFGAWVLATAGDACDRCRGFVSWQSATAYGKTAVDALPFVRQLTERGHGVAALSYVERLGEPKSDIRLCAQVATCRLCARELYFVEVAVFGNVRVSFVPLGEETPATPLWKTVPGYKVTGATGVATTAAPLAAPVPV